MLSFKNLRVVQHYKMHYSEK